VIMNKSYVLRQAYQHRRILARDALVGPPRRKTNWVLQQANIW
jgi:hypothetical protein